MRLRSTVEYHRLSPSPLLPPHMLSGLLLSLAWDTKGEGRRKREVKGGEEREERKEGEEGRGGERRRLSTAANILSLRC